MQKFEVTGLYNYDALPNKKGRLAGEIFLGDNGSFEGEIIDYASISPHQRLKGILRQDASLDQLVFLKFPQNAILANLLYILTKQSNGSFDGKYTGNWKAVPYKVEINQDLGLLIVQKDLSLIKLGDKAELELKQV